MIHQETCLILSGFEQNSNPWNKRQGMIFILCKFYFDCFHQATPQKLISHVVADHSAIDPTYVEDLLLTYKTFLDRPSQICSQLLNWFLERPFRDKVRFLFFSSPETWLCKQCGNHLLIVQSAQIISVRNFSSLVDTWLIVTWLTFDWWTLDWLTFGWLALNWWTLDWLTFDGLTLGWLTFDWLTLDWLTFDWLLIAGDARNASLGQ